MKIWVKIPVIVVGVVMLGAYRAPVMAVCNSKDNEHQNTQIHRCDYSQKDLKRIRKMDKDRHKEIGVEKGQCFFCGCSVASHTEE